MTTPKRKVQEKEISHKVLGLTGQEEIEVSEKRTFCDLCKRAIAIGDSFLHLEAESGWKFRIHVDCAIAQKTRLHNKVFRDDVKVRPQTRRTQQNKKKEHKGTGTEYCAFCAKSIKEEEVYCKEGKKSFHAGVGRNTCYKRYKRVVTNTKSSLT